MAEKVNSVTKFQTFDNNSKLYITRTVSHLDNVENEDLFQTHNTDKNDFGYSKFSIRIHINFVALYFLYCFTFGLKIQLIYSSFLFLL